jgi:hypothetical protein
VLPPQYSLSQSDLVLLEVMSVEVFAPITIDVAAEELAWRLI